MTGLVVRVFNEVAGVYDEVLPFFSGIARPFVADLDPAPGIRVLDLGAGRGAITAEVLARGCVVTAVDAAPAMIAQLAAAYPDVDARVMDAHRLSFVDGSFDLVTAGFVMHLLDDIPLATSEVFRVLAPGGTFSFLVPGPHPGEDAPPDVSNRLFAEFTPYLPPGGSMGTPFEELEMLARAGFIDCVESYVQVRLPVADGQTFWRWVLSSGTRKFVDDLPAERRVEFHDRMVAELDALDRIELFRTCWVYTGRKPS